MSGMNAKFTFLLPFICLWTMSTTGHTQNARETAFVGQPLIYSKSGKIDGCGVRLIAIDESSNADGPRLVIDASLQLSTRWQAMVVKATAGRMLLENGKLQNRKIATVERAWFRADGLPPTKAVTGKMISTIDPVGGVIYPTTRLEDLEILIAMTSGKPIEMGLKLRGEPTETVWFGVVTLSTGESARIDSCLKELLEDRTK
ncbi:hypothetical protein LP416_21880 [Polaromonas sp. P2-4]|nr:hypothetical protein LP416_21880 [Polaromonas sp. P2-4]